ncbi:IS66 family insertion sequence hypothetical protein [Parashewanella curva]|uniref:IS66 family insertion sequence element accessory protein TnpB n=1 Tax=Parashewanella curva TaxID=2338552 RepID=A0A3L8PQX5_9GAMM|nr:hypothetical protein [Parashewanella curva]RLV57791.1 IS66 family insertion sequence hypothetical protein [Parashewanella curva]
MTARNYRTAEQWQQVFQLFEQSNLSISDFCRQHKLSTSCFYAWRKRCASLEVDTSPTTPPSEQWQSITLPKLNSAPKETERSWDIELSLPNGVTLKMRNHVAS